jgi:hypothetical protein
MLWASTACYRDSFTFFEGFFFVFFSPARQMTGSYLDCAMTACFQILCNSSFISHINMQILTALLDILPKIISGFTSQKTVFVIARSSGKLSSRLVSIFIGSLTGIRQRDEIFLGSVPTLWNVSDITSTLRT